jgi:tetratricopeptide (TPR) repeat protein
VWQEWAYSLERQGDYEGAVDRYLQAVEHGSISAHAGLGRVLIELEHFEEALVALKTVIASPETTDFKTVELARLDLARALIELRRYEEAVASASQASEQYAMFINRLRSVDGAVLEASFRKLIAISSLLSGAAYFGLRRYPEAIKQFESAGKQDTAFAVQGLWAAAAVRWRQGRYQDWWTTIKAVLDAWEETRARGDEPTAEEFIAYAGALTSLGRGRQALDVLRRASERYADQPSIWLAVLMLRLEERQGPAWGMQPGEDALLDSEPWRVDAREAFVQAERLLNQQIRRAPLMATNLGLGHLYAVFHDHDRGWRHLHEVLDRDPHSVLALANLGAINATEQRYDNAIEFFGAALRREPDEVLIRLQLAEANLRSELLDEAEKHYQAVLDSAPSNIEANVGLGEVMSASAEKGDAELFEQAVSYFSNALDLARDMRGDPANWKGSSRLATTSAASIIYARGYARAKLYEARLSEGFFGRHHEIDLLRDAARDFSEAAELDEHHFKARRAYKKASALTKRLSPQRVADSIAPSLLAGLALLLFLLAQVSAIWDWPLKLKPSEWALASFGALLFIVAGLSLPQLRKLKVGGIELERRVVESVSVTSLGLARQTIRVVSLRPLQPPMTAPRPHTRRPHFGPPELGARHAVEGEKVQKGVTIPQAKESVAQQSPATSPLDAPANGDRPSPA